MTAPQLFSRRIVARIQELIQEVRSFDRLSAAQTMALRLERAVTVLDGEAAGSGGFEGYLDRPVCIVLLGGTGVGKSELFNALLDKPGLSPTSATIRPKTTHAHVAAAPADKQHLTFLDEADVVTIDHRLSGTVLIDAPDVDSTESVHLERTRRLVERADIVVYVGSPDKRANFRVQDEVRRWAARKRWFFVLNKLDQIPEQDREAVCADFLGRVRELGFDLDLDGFFAVSAVAAQNGANGLNERLERLRAALFAHRAREQVRALRVEDAFNQIRHALSGSARGDLETLHQTLLTHERELDQRVRSVFLRAVSTPQSRDMLRRIIREQAWRAAPGRVGGFLALPVWMRGRLAFSGLAYHLARMSAGGPSLTRMLRAGWHAAKAAWQGILPMRTILQGFSAEEERRLTEVVQDARRTLQDLGLDRLDGAKPSVPEPPASSPEAEQALWTARLLHQSLNVLRSQGVLPRTSEHLEQDQRTREIFQERLEQAVLASADQLAVQRLGLAHTLAGNLLPVLVFGHAALRLVLGWLAGEWLPFDFYLTAVAVFLISLFPGYLLVSVALTRSGDLPPPEQLVQALDAPAETESLRRVREGIEDLLNQVRDLEDALRVNLEVLQQELDPSRFGAVVHEAKND
ncbi:GTPase domain-containing protein [Desulfonatronum lacustre]|uniref:GTPase domain-containing protein n=1 Tax=Desulfonatronum lacustre TaxID=66849 RepID=UPI00048E39C0|nr:GTPase domain-containing protein [Desulfonatronum lacustre]